MGGTTEGTTERSTLPAPRELRDLLEAKRRGEPFVVYRSPEGPQEIYRLPSDDASVGIGRAHADITLFWDTEVSRLHAQLERVGKAWTVVDDGLSRNGTFVNGRRLQGRRRLTDGDVLRVGKTALTFHAPSPADQEETSAGGSIPSADDLSPSQRKVLTALCRPYAQSHRFTAPASNQDIAAELFLSLDTVKGHLRALFDKFELNDLPQNQKRARLAEVALEWGLVSPRDL